MALPNRFSVDLFGLIGTMPEKIWDLNLMIMDLPKLAGWKIPELAMELQIWDNHRTK